MNTRARTHFFLRRMKSFLGVFLGVLIILAALCTGVGRLLLPEAHRYRFELQDVLSRRLGHQVRIGEVSGDWIAGPQLEIKNLDVLASDGTALVHFAEAMVVMDALRWLGGGNFVSLAVAGAQLDFRAQANGAIQIAGLSFHRADSAPDDTYGILTSGLVDFKNASVSYQGPGMSSPWRLRNVDMSLRSGRGFSLTARVPGDSGGTIKLRGRLPGLFGKEPVSGHVYTRLEKVDLAAALGHLPGFETLDSGHADAELWLTLRDGHLSDLRWRGTLKNFQLHHLDGKSVEVASLGGSLAWVRDAGGWNVAISPLNVEVKGTPWPESTLMIRRSEDHYSVLADYLRLEDVLTLTKLIPARYRPFPDEIADSIAAGEIRNLHLEYGQTPAALASIQFRFSGLAIPPRYAAGAGISGLDGSLRMRRDGGQLVLDSRQVHVAWPGMFRSPAAMENLTASLDWRLDPQQRWQSGHYQVRLNYAGSGISSNGLLRADPGSAPYVDLAFKVQAGATMADIRRVLPLPLLNPSLAEWLPNALRSGSVGGMQGVLRGNLDSWPFPRHDGIVEVEASFDDLNLDYAPGWPAGEHLHLVTRLLNDRMTYSTRGGQIGRLALQGLTATMPNVDRPSLVAEINASARAGGIQDFLLNSPLRDTFSAYLGVLQLSGDGEAKMRLQLPLGQTPGEVRIKGDVQLRDNQLANRSESFKLQDINAGVGFSADSIEVKHGSASYQGIPVSWELGAGAAADIPGAKLTAKLSGNASLADLWPGDLPLVLASHLTGASDWQASLLVKDINAPVAINLDSALVGTEMTLPAPLGKPATMPVPLNIKFLAPLQPGDPLSLRLGQVIAATLILPDATQGLKYDIAFGGQTPQVWPQGKHLGGHLGLLDIDGWRKVLAEQEPPEPGAHTRYDVQPDSIDLKLDSMRLFNRNLPAFALSGVETRRYWDMKISGDAAIGTVRFPLADAQSDLIVGEFQRLSWPVSPATDSVSAMAEQVPPPVQIAVDDFRFGDYSLGKLQLEGFPELGSYHIERLRFVTDQHEVNATGDWGYKTSDPHSTIHIHANTSDLGDLLQRFGYAGMILGAPGTLEATLDWPDAPWNMEPGKLHGTLSLNLGEGRFVEMQPGAGRLLGLVSVTALPRRLALDFSDFFGKGLGFDSILGNFVLRDGVAYTEDFKVKAPAADITLTGSTDLAAQTYDQAVQVTPNMSGPLPLVGGLAGGPAAAAILLVLQQALKKPMGNLAEDYYRVTGPWEKPEIKLLARPKGGKAEKRVGQVPPASAG